MRTVRRRIRVDIGSIIRADSNRFQGFPGDAIAGPDRRADTRLREAGVSAVPVFGRALVTAVPPPIGCG